MDVGSKGASARRAGLFSAKHITIHSAAGTRDLHISPTSQALLSVAAVAAAGWFTFATVDYGLDVVDAGHSAALIVSAEDYEARLDELATERDVRAREAQDARARFTLAMERVGEQQDTILGHIADNHELSLALDLTRQKLASAVADRDNAVKETAALRAEFAALNEEHRQTAGNDTDLADTLGYLSAALTETARERDAAQTRHKQLQTEIADLELALLVNAKEQDRVFEQLEQAVQASFEPMQTMFSQSEIDLESLLASVQRDYTGAGGPGVTLSSRSIANGDLGNRFDEMMHDLDRMNLMRIAASKIPFTMPVRDTHRFTSGFGYRRDPKGRGRRMHAGIDLAAPRGTAIFATADGVVKSARRESGYGNTVRIVHDFGFETVYAHQSRLRVKAGDRVSRGDRIGDMGTTGRSTGVHLHYEVRLNGRPVNPMIYLKAAKNVL